MSPEAKDQGKGALSSGRAKAVYELKPINFFNLSEGERSAVLDSFVGLINSVSSLTSFYVMTDLSRVVAGSNVIEQKYKRYFIETEDDLDGALAGYGFRFVKLLSMPRPKVKGAVRNFMILEDGRLARVFNAYALPSQLPYGFLSKYYDLADEIRLDVKPVAEAERFVEKQYRTLSAKLMSSAQVDARSQLYLQALEEARVRIASGSEKLFEVRLTLTVTANSYEELRSRSLSLLKALDYIEAPQRVQRMIYELKGPQFATGRWLYLTSSGLAAFFPFAGMDLIDPGGIFLGLNLQTRNAVIFDVFERDNYNVTVLGQTGYGKSMLIKAWLSRLAQVDDSSLIYIFDSIVRPEYAAGSDGTFETSLAKEIGAQVVRFSDPEETYGFDPFLVFESRKDAGEFIRELAKVDEGSEEAVEILSLARECSDIEDLIGRASPGLRRRLEAELEPMMRFFTGRTDIYDRMVFVLSDIQSPIIRDAVAFLILASLWRTIKQQPPSLRKFIVVDEGWAFVEENPRTGKPYFPLAVEFVPEIARTGRHYSTAFIIASQLVSDFAKGPGRVVIENSATKIVLRQDSASLKLIKDMLNLSEVEGKFVLSARPGQGIIITPEGHVPFYNYLFPEELKRFSTRPSDL